MRSKFKCTSCQRIFQPEVTWFRFSECDHSICGQCSEFLTKETPCLAQGCKQILLTENQKNVSKLLQDEFLMTIQTITNRTCLTHSESLHFICLDSQCEKRAIFHCYSCTKQSHSQCNIDLKLDVEDFLKFMTLDFGEVVQLFEKVGTFFQSRNIEAVNWIEFKPTIRTGLGELLRLESDFTNFNVNSFQVDFKDKEAIVQSVFLKDLEAIFEELHCLLIEKCSIEDLNLVCQKLDKFTSHKNIRLIEKTTNIQSSDSNTDEKYSRSCKKCSQNSNKTKAIEELDKIISEKRENVPLIAVFEQGNLILLPLENKSIENEVDKKQENNELLENIKKLNLKIVEIELRLEKLEKEKTHVEEVLEEEKKERKALELKISVLGDSGKLVPQNQIGFDPNVNNFGDPKKTNWNFSNCSEEFQIKTPTSSNYWSVEDLKSRRNSLIERFPKNGLLTIEHVDFLVESLPSFANIQLILNSVNDGGDARTFHALCDGQGPTMIVIKVGDFLAGGYTDQDWEGEDVHKHSDQSFLFSLNYFQKFELRIDRRPIAIYCDSEIGPCFGGGSDLFVSSDYKSMENQSNLGQTYFDAGVESPKEYLFGSNKFAIQVYEVYKLF